MKAVGEEEVLEAGEMGGETEVKDGTGEKSVMFVEDAALAPETQEREGGRQGGVGREPVRRGEEVGPVEVGGGERDVV